LWEKKVQIFLLLFLHLLLVKKVVGLTYSVLADGFWAPSLAHSPAAPPAKP
jgi:hypothetical protein